MQVDDEVWGAWRRGRDSPCLDDRVPEVRRGIEEDIADDRAEVRAIIESRLKAAPSAEVPPLKALISTPPPRPSTGDVTGAAYRGTITPLDVPTDVVSRMPADVQRRLAAKYSTIELSDSMARLAVDQTGSARAEGPLNVALFNLNGTIWNLGVAAFAARMGRALRSTELSAWINRALGGLFVYLGVRLALFQAR